MVDIKTFVFSSYDHKGETGRWDIVLDENGHISVSQLKNDDVEFTGMSKLDNNGMKLWNLIKEAELEKFKDISHVSSDEKKEMVFDYKDNEKEFSIIVFQEDVENNEKIQKLLRELERIISIVSGKTPKF
ncbi:MAG: hypothetical protein ACTSRZ_10140 [Promethearchaeota archaeon]